MRYFQLINPIKGKYPLIGEKEIYKEENNIQILILKRDIIANHPNEQMEIAHDLSLEDVQREQAYLDAKMEQEITFESHPISFIQQLEQEIEDNHPSRLTSEDIEDVSDNYQAHLEYKWWKDEQLELIKDLKSKLTKEQLELYNQFNS